MFPDYHERIRLEALEAYPEEAVWLITQAGCRRVPNVASDATQTFRVAKSDMLSAQSEGLLAVVHSHPGHPAYPSEEDMRGQLSSAVPWAIVATDGINTTPLLWWGDDVPKPPLLDRTFRHGVTDCYALIRDYFSLEHGIELPEFPRSWEWWRDGKNFYLDGFPRAGFRELDLETEAPRPGDVWFSQIRSPVPNHAGVYLGGDMIMHHLTSRSGYDDTCLSRREPIARWMPHITQWVRHKELDK